MKRMLCSLAIVTALAFPIGVRAAAAPMATMPTCAAGDPVVWINTKSNVYHPQSDRYFGKTKSGRYACQSAAITAGAHAVGSKSGAMSGTMTTSAPHRHSRNKGLMSAPSPTPSP